MQLHQRGAGEVRPLVVAYHVSGAALLRKVADFTTVASFVGTPLKGQYRVTSAKNPTLDDLVVQLGEQTGARAFWPIVLLGFSEGCQGVRHQLRQEFYPQATITIDGVHASLPPAEWQIEVWRKWFARCGADLSAPPSEQCAPDDAKPMAVLTCTQIETRHADPPYLSTRETAEIITGWGLSPGPTSTDPRMLCSGNLWVHSFPGASAEAHIDQGTRVLPAALEGVARQLGFGPDSPAPPPGLPPKPGPAPPGAPGGGVLQVARRIGPAVLFTGALALAIEAQDTNG